MLTFSDFPGDPCFWIFTDM